MKQTLAVCAVLCALVSWPADARERTPRPAQISIHVDTSIADRTLGLVCSGQPIDERAVRASPIVQAQIAHNSGLIAAATMDAYVEALRAISACTPQAHEVFHVGDIIAHRDAYRAKIEAISARQSELASSVAERLAPYVPAGVRFQRALILAVPYFSCGGFEREEYFFIDVECLADDIETDFVALQVLIAHETFHGLQARTFFPAPIDADEITDTDSGLDDLFGTMLREGTATYVAGTSEVLQAPPGGMLTSIAQSFGRTNRARLETNFQLLSILYGYVAEAPPDQARQRAETVEDMAFDGGAFEEFGYYVGARMAGDIESAWGRGALVCVMQLPAEQFILAHDAAVAADSLRLSPQVIDTARRRAQSRGGDHSFQSCRTTGAAP
ncbi:MAG: DUF5700 domain-containing putative Zn-dependent protease [Hyphomonadaceae bacterium]